MNVLGFIPARGGSSRVPSKNIRMLDGKPLILHTIATAKAAKQITRVVVSTDSEEIARIALQGGAEVPFLRPKEISGGKSTEMEFFDHALAWFKKEESYVPDVIVLLYPTSPFRRPDTIDRAISEFKLHPEADSLRSVRLCSEHPYKMWVVEGDWLKPFVEGRGKDLHTMSYQTLPTVYIQNASIYITKPATIDGKRSPTGDLILPFIMDELESVDINSELDFKFAQLLFKAKQGERNL